MNTKKEERDALNKIVAILSTLDNDGYVNTAFAGCVEDACQNIANDFALSWQDRAECYKNGMEQAQRERDEARSARMTVDAEFRALTAQYNALREDCTGTSRALKEEHDRADAATAALDNAERENARLINEIIMLKAKLYDFITA